MDNEIQKVETKQIRKQANQLLQKAESQLVRNPNEAREVDGIIRLITAGLNEAEKKRKSRVAGIIETKRLIDADFKEAAAPYAEAKRILTAKLKEYRVEQQRIENEAREAAEAERRKREAAQLAEEERRRKISLAKGGMGQITPVPEPELVPEPKSFAAEDTTTTRWNWDVELIDPKLLPIDILTSEKVKGAIESVARKMMFAAERAKDEDKTPLIDIPGIKIYQKEVLVFA